MTKERGEFQEIGHCGGKLTITACTTAEGRRSIQLGISHSAPRPASWFMVYGDLASGTPVATARMGGLGADNEPPLPQGCVPIFIGSDVKSMWGHQCPKCDGYWRSDAVPSDWRMTCAYCGLRASTHVFRSAAQERYIRACCERVVEVVNSDEDGEFPVDLDAIADALAAGVEKPAFYYAEESQQNNFKCDACGARNDVLGKYAYCSSCGTHNALQELRSSCLAAKERAAKGEHIACVKDVVSTFDSSSRALMQQLLKRSPMRKRRRQHFESVGFHNLVARRDDFAAAFDIDLFNRIKEEDVQFAKRMFHRRHVYEHRGGEADERYISDSGDTSVRPKQALRETEGSALRTADVVERMFNNFHDGFADIFPAEPKPIEYQKHSTRRRQNRAGGT